MKKLSINLRVISGISENPVDVSTSPCGSWLSLEFTFMASFTDSARPYAFSKKTCCADGSASFCCVVLKSSKSVVNHTGKQGKA